MTKRIWENGDSCVSVVELRVNGGEHDWPGSFGNMDINSDNEIWNFVSNFSINGLIEECSLNTETLIDDSLRLYPNPVINHLIIINANQETSLKISDIKGSIIRKFDLFPSISISLPMC